MAPAIVAIKGAILQRNLLRSMNVRNIGQISKVVRGWTESRQPRWY
jgi:hypothetical protein